MNAVRRTTIKASTDELATLEAEARRRGVPLTTVVSEAITEKAISLRKARRPRLGVGASAGRSAGAAHLTAEPVAEDPR
jgi:hypothetical protein